MPDRYAIEQEVDDYLEGWRQHYDVPEIMAELLDYQTADGDRIRSLDDVDPDDWLAILERHDRTSTI